MSREVDERVVAMYFDNKNFEKNAKTTIETLGELKSSMDLTKAAKGFDVLKKASEDLKLDDVARKAKNLQSTFKTLGSTLTNVFKIGTGPLNSLHNLFKTFQSYVTKFIGFDLAGKLVNGIENAIRQLTIAPVSAGFKEYELKMDSIKTIMSGTGESLDTVTQKIQELNKYADQTIYSFSDMTSNIGKFTNNKVPLDDATAAIKGISNAAADAGQGAQQASMAMYNLSQAMGVGSLKLIDFKSLENANIATVRLKETFMEAGAAHGQLIKKMTKNKATGEMEVHYYMKDPKTGKKYKDKGTKKFAEVTAENFRETLNKDWANKEVILDTFKIYSGEIKSIDDLKRMGYNEATGFSDEDLQKLVDIGTAAMEAATQVRTFTKMWDALKEAAQSGWSETLEYIFGDMEEGTKLWTRLNDRISGWLGKSADARNSAFAQWRGMQQREDGTWVKTRNMWIRQIDEHGNFRMVQIMKEQADGRRILLDSFFELIDVIESLGGAVGTAWTDVFGKFDSNVLWNITNGFRDFVKSLKAWIGTADDSNSRLSKITRGLRGVFTIAKIVVNFFKSQISLLTKAMQPFVDLAVDIFGKFGDFFDTIDHTNIGTTLSSLGTAFTNLWNKIRNTNWDTVKAKFAEVWTSMKNNVREWMYDNGLGGVWETLSGWKTSVTEWFDGVRASLDTAWGTVTKWFDESGIGGFFSDIWSWIKEKFGIGDNSANKHIPSNIILENGDIQGEPQLSFVDSFIQTLGQIKTDLDAAWKEVSDWFESSGIAGFFRGIWDDINYLFEPHWEYTDSEMGYKTEAPIVTFFKGIPTAMQSAWDTVTGWSGWDTIGSFFSGIWDDVSIWFEPTVGENGEPGDSPIVAFFKGIPAAMESAWNSVVEWFERSGIGDFFKNLWDTISSPFQSKWVYTDSEMGYKEEAPIITFFKNLKSDLEGVWSSITSWNGWADIGKFFTDTFGWLSNLLSGKATEGGTNGEANPAKGITDLVDSVKEVASGAEGADDSVGIIQRILTAVSGFFNDIGTFIGTVTKQTGADKAFETVKDIIEIIGELITILVGFLHKVIVEKDLGYQIAAAIGVIATIVATISANHLRAKILSALSETEGIGEMFMRICAGILMVSAAVALLSSLDSAKMWEAVGAVAVIAVLVGVVVVAINKLTQTTPSTDKPVTALERIANNAIKWAGVMGTLWVAMKELPAIINAMKDSGISGEDISQVVLSIIELVGGISLIVVLASKFGGGDIAAMAKASIGVVAGVAIIVTGLIGVFSTIGAATEKIGGAGTTDRMIESAKRTGALVTAITEAIGAAYVGFATGGKKALQDTYGDLEADNVKRAAEMAEEFTPERLMALVRFVNTMHDIGDKLPSDISSISSFAQKLPEIGTNLAKFAYDFKTYFNMEGRDWGDFDTVSDATAKIHGMINLMQDVAELIQYVRVKAGFGSGWDSDTERKFKNFGELSKRIIEMIQEGLGDSDSLSLQFDAKPIVDSIVVALGYGETAIAKAVHAMVQAGIDNSNNPQKAGTYTPPTVDFWNGNLGLPGAGDGTSLLGNAPIININSILGEGGFQGMINSAIGSMDLTELSATLASQMAPLGEQFKDTFKLTNEDVPSMLSDFLPTGENGEIDADAVLSQFQDKFDTLNRELDASGANTVTIRPVFDVTDLESGIEQINAYFRQNPIMVNAGDATPQITFNLDNNGTISEIRLVQQGITNVITQIHDENVANMETMASLARNINGIAEAVSAMKVILDTGVIAGAVDDYLGYTAFVASRTGG